MGQDPQAAVETERRSRPRGDPEVAPTVDSLAVCSSNCLIILSEAPENQDGRGGMLLNPTFGFPIKGGPRSRRKGHHTLAYHAVLQNEGLQVCASNR